MAIKTYFGFEIEAVYNSQLLTFNVGEYHEGIKCGEYWKIEKDGSIKTYLNTRTWKNWGRPIEFVSKKLSTEQQIKEALEEFYNICSKNKQYELSEVLEFNQSVGFHIHFSVFKNGKEIRFSDFIDKKVFFKLRRRLFKELKLSNIPSKALIKKHYYRGFAKKLNTSHSNFRIDGDRYNEFNFESEGYKGFEWRSPNFLGINTWTDFKFLVNLYLKYVDFMIKKLLRDKNKENIVIEEEEIKTEPVENIIKLSQRVQNV